MASDAVKNALDQGGVVISMPPVLADDCPVQALGHGDEIYWFVNSVGEVVARGAGAFKAAQLLSLFGGDPGWLIANFNVEKPSRGDQEPFSVGEARNTLMRACIAAGFFNPGSDLRGAGVWSDDAGGLVIHCGDRVQHVAKGHPITGDGWKHAAVRFGDYIYPASKPEPLPRPADGGENPAEALLDLLKTWNWKRPDTDPLLMLGALAAGFVVGALNERPITYLIADSGSGKSSLFTLARKVWGPETVFSDDPTADGIKKHVRRNARPVIIDEIEIKESNTKAQAIIELARGAYTRGAGISLRGGNDPQMGQLDAIFMFGSVQPPPMKPQDINRQVVLELNELAADVDAKDKFEEKLPLFAALGPVLRHRMVAGFPALAAATSAFRRALIAEGHDSRGADTYGTVLATGWVFRYGDMAVDVDDAAMMAMNLNATAVAARTDAIPSHEQCWNAFLTAHLELWSGGSRRVVGDIIQNIIDEPYDHQIRKAFRGFGVSVVELIGEADIANEREMWIAVAPRSRGLQEIFRGTDWAHGGWRIPLERLPGARRSKGAIRFGPGLRTQATLIPINLLLMSETDAAEAVDNSIGELE